MQPPTHCPTVMMTLWHCTSCHCQSLSYMIISTVRLLRSRRNRRAHWDPGGHNGTRPEDHQCHLPIQRLQLPTTVVKLVGVGATTGPWHGPRGNSEDAPSAPSFFFHAVGQLPSLWVHQAILCLPMQQNRAPSPGGLTPAARHAERRMAAHCRGFCWRLSKSGRQVGGVNHHRSSLQVRPFHHP
jgi:hypothetical protein